MPGMEFAALAAAETGATTAEVAEVQDAIGSWFMPVLITSGLTFGLGANGIDELELVQREVPVGPFFLDLLAKDAEGRTIAVENQLLPSAAG